MKFCKLVARGIIQNQKIVHPLKVHLDVLSPRPKTNTMRAPARAAASYSPLRSSFRAFDSQGEVLLDGLPIMFCVYLMSSAELGALYPAVIAHFCTFSAPRQPSSPLSVLFIFCCSCQLNKINTRSPSQPPPLIQILYTHWRIAQVSPQISEAPPPLICEGSHYANASQCLLGRQTFLPHLSMTQAVSQQQHEFLLE